MTAPAAAPETPHAAPITYGRVLSLAAPASVAAALTPLLGVADAWALGRSDRPLDVGAVGLAAAIFSLLYWSFGFLRMGTAGLTAQAVGRGDEAEARAVLARAGLGAVAIGALLVLLQWPIGAAAFALMGAGAETSAETMGAAREYFGVRVWSAPAALLSYAVFGWLMARGRTGLVMAAGGIATLLNVGLDYWFAVEMGLGAAGVAWGTLIAETVGAALAIGAAALDLNRVGGLAAHWRGLDLRAPKAVATMLALNRDIFLRTVVLAFCFAWFGQRGATLGDVPLAANQVLLQLMLAAGLALDGAAIAAETLAGAAIGGGDRARYRTAVARTSQVAAAAAGGFMLIYVFAGGAIVDGLTTDPAIRAAAREYLPWVIASPVVVATCFQLDGIFVGAARARDMRDTMYVSAAFFLPVSIVATSRFGAHGLWAAYMAFFLVRAVTLGLRLKGIERDISREAHAGT